jgi:branched-chain amino acid transport system permease protein
VLNSVLSGDYPRSRTLAALLLAVLVALALAPFLFPGTRSLMVAARICIFVVLVASYDVLLGYTGIVSFAHTMFFGIGAYGVAIAVTHMGPRWGALLVGALAALVLTQVLALVIGLFSLRVRAIFFAMMTLAVASAFAILASQLSGITGGEDGLSFRMPRMLTPAFKLFGDKLFGVRINGRVISYYLVFFSSCGLFVLMLRVVNSPFGRVLQSIRENDFRAEALGYPTVVYRTTASCFSAGMAALAGVLMAIWLRYNGPDTTLSFDIMIDILLMVVIGGMGTLYGSVLGVVIVVLAQYYLQDLMGAASEAAAGIPLLPAFLQPDRWLLWLGVLFILSVYFFPTGIVGKLRSAKT